MSLGDCSKGDKGATVNRFAMVQKKGEGKGNGAGTGMVPFEPSCWG